MNDQGQILACSPSQAVRWLALLLIAVAVRSWAAETYWIDVRSTEEYAEDHLAQAANIPYTEIASRIGEVTHDPDANIYLYCRTGHRAGIAREALQQAGFKHVTNVGGLQDARVAAARLQACATQPAADCPPPPK